MHGSGVEVEILYFNKLPGDAASAGPYLEHLEQQSSIWDPHRFLNLQGTYELG